MPSALPMNDAFTIVRGCLRTGAPVAWATVIQISPTQRLPDDEPGMDLTSPPQEAPALGAKIVVRPGATPLGTFNDSVLDQAVTRDTLAALEDGRSAIKHYGSHGVSENDLTVFIEVFVAPRRMVICGAADFTAALVRVAKVLGYRVTVCDARAVFATETRFPEADEVIVDWPHRYLTKARDHLGPRDAVCVLSHDHKFDVPAIIATLDSRVGYIGAMGSRQTHAERIERLRGEGIDELKLTRVMSPIGLDIGARTPGETAVAIMAEIIAVQAGVAVPSLREGSGPIHRMVQ